jgi:type IV pilus assembly protein PilM
MSVTFGKTPAKQIPTSGFFPFQQVSLSRITIIDCGASRTALGIFSLNKGGLRCDHLAAETIPHGTGDSWLAHTIAALRVLGAQPSHRGPAVLILPPHLVLLKHVRTPRVEADKRDRIVRFEVEQNIPYAVAEVIWDTVVSGEGETGEDLLLAAVKLDLVTPLCAAARAAGFEVRAVLPSALATRAAEELARPTTDDRLLILNVGARSATLLQVDGARFAARTWTLGVPTGAPDADALATRLAQETTRSLMHFERHNGLEAPTRVVLTGGMAREPELAGRLAEKLKLPVGTLQVSATLELAPAASAGSAVFPGLAELAGAATLQLLPGQPSLNLMPAGLRRRAHLRQRRPWLVAAALLVLGAFIPPLLHYRTVAGTARADTAAIEETLVPLRARDARNRTGLEQLAALKQQVAQLQSVEERRAAWLKLFADLQERFTRVEDVWLDNLQTIPPANNAPMKLVISGRMLDKTNPLAKVSPETFTRVKALLAGIVDSPFVSAVEGERFDNSRPGILKFDFVLVTDPAHPL